MHNDDTNPHLWQRLQLHYDETARTLSILSPGGQRVSWSDDGHNMTVSDGSGNSIVMSREGIQVKSYGNLSLSCDGTLTLKAQSVAVESQADTSVKAMNVNVAANAALKLTGASTAEVSAMGITTVKGAMVMIN